MFGNIDVKDIERLEGMFLSMRKDNIIHEWINSLSKVSNSVMMSVTEKAKGTTLISAVEILNLKVPVNKTPCRKVCLSLVRKEITKQRRILILKEFKS